MNSQVFVYKFCYNKYNLLKLQKLKSVLFFSLRRYGLGAHSKISLLRYMLEISHDKNCSLKKIEVLRDLSVSVTLATEMCV